MGGSLRRPFLRDVAERRSDFARRREANFVIGSRDVGFIIGEPTRQGMSKPGQTGAAADVNQDMEVFAAFSLMAEKKR